VKELVPCIGCGGLFPDIDGPTHRYMESSPGCWAAFGEVLEREYSDPVYFEIHRLTVDSYAAQHPGQPSPQCIRSVGYHLIRICLLLERGLEMETSNDAMLQVTKHKREFTWLTPPALPGLVTIADVHRAENAEEHKRVVRAWASAVWDAWSSHHNTIYGWIDRIDGLR